MIGVLGISHKDITTAAMWFRWAARIDQGSERLHRLLVFSTPLVGERVASNVSRDIPSFETSFHTAHVHERGYPGSASHLFVLAMEEAGRLYPNEPLLWIESDAIPTRPGWFGAIADEYARCDKPFMGHLESEHDIKHLAGVAVYPPNWKELSPMLAGSHLAPDIPHWGRGRGQAFDAYAAPEVYPLSCPSQTIFQSFGKRRWRPVDLSIIPASACLVHQSKDGSLIRVLEQRK